MAEKSNRMKPIKTKKPPLGGYDITAIALILFSFGARGGT
jgi:uncharacterized protein YggT (Ycf19 family)